MNSSYEFCIMGCRIRPEYEWVFPRISRHFGKWRDDFTTTFSVLIAMLNVYLWFLGYAGVNWRWVSPVLFLWKTTLKTNFVSFVKNGISERKKYANTIFNAVYKWITDFFSIYEERKWQTRSYIYTTEDFNHLSFN